MRFLYTFPHPDDGSFGPALDCYETGRQVIREADPLSSLTTGL